MEITFICDLMTVTTEVHRDDTNADKPVAIAVGIIEDTYEINLIKHASEILVDGDPWSG